jgi:hypothetical protein
MTQDQLARMIFRHLFQWFEHWQIDERIPDEAIADFYDSITTKVEAYVGENISSFLEKGE